MTDDETTKFGERMKRMEQDIAEIKRALLGNLEGQGGLLERVRRREEMSAIFDLRLREAETRLDTVERQQRDWQAQGRLLNYLAGGGGVAGLLALLWTLLRAFGGG